MMQLGKCQKCVCFICLPAQGPFLCVGRWFPWEPANHERGLGSCLWNSLLGDPLPWAFSFVPNAIRRVRLCDMHLFQHRPSSHTPNWSVVLQCVHHTPTFYGTFRAAHPVGHSINVRGIEQLEGSVFVP